MTRVLLLSQFYAPVVGGTERVVEDTARALARRGHAVSVATLAEGRDGVAAEDVRVHRLRSSAQRVPGLYAERERPHAIPAPDPEVVFALRRIVARDRPHVVHAHDWLVYSYLPLRRLGGPPVLLSLHDYGLVCATKRLFREGVPCSGPRLAKCIACASGHYGTLRGAGLASATRAGDGLLRASIDMFLPVSETVALGTALASSSARFHVVPNFVPSDLASRVAASGASDDLPADFLLYVGDATHDKGIDTLLAAHAMLPCAPPLVVIGRRYSTALRSPRSDVRVLGPRDHALTLGAMLRSTMTVVPSLVPETFGMVALEAMSLGRPVVASRVGGLAELIRHGETGLLVAPGDADALRRALERLLQTPAEREAIGVAARTASCRFAEEAVLPRLEDAYRAVLAKTPERVVPKRERG